MIFLADLRNIYTVTDNAFAEVRKHYGDEVQCGKGCDDCCHAVFDVSLVEAVNLLKHFHSLQPEEQELIHARAVKALEEWNTLIRHAGDVSAARIRCPLLNEKGQCSCYEARPVNCRTYGIPTVIAGAGHVCGFSGFEPGKQYPTVNLEKIQQALYELSTGMANSENGGKRWPLAAILLGQDEVGVFLRGN